MSKQQCLWRHHPHLTSAIKGEESFAAPSSAAWPILQDDALGPELFADPIGGREVAVLLGLGALGDAGVDMSCSKKEL